MRKRKSDLSKPSVSLYSTLSQALKLVSSPPYAIVLDALSKAMATIATHSLVVTKTMLQSSLPECRQGKSFRGFTGVLYIVKNEMKGF